MSSAAADDLEEIPELAQQMIDRVEEVEQVGDRRGVGVDVDEDGRVEGGELPGWKLPGFADEPMQDDCTDDIPHFCDECGATHTTGRRCGQSRCPECWQKWAIDKTETHAARADAVAKYKGSSGEAHHKHHVGFMLPADWRPTGSPQERYEKTRQVVKDIIADIWGYDAVYCYHAWSGSGYGEHEGHGDDLGEWKDRLPDGTDHRDWEGDVRDELHKRPHFHAVIVAPEIPGGNVTKSFYEQTGWIIERFHGDDNRSIDGDEELAQAMSYSFSHSAIDTTGDRNESHIHTCGSTWHNYSQVKVLEETKRSIKRAVRAVAPRVLGIEESAVRCEQEIAPETKPEADEHHTHDHENDADDEPDAGGSGDVSFTGRVVSIDEAAGRVKLQSGTEQQVVSVDGDVKDYNVGDHKTATGTIGDDGELEGDLEDPREDCQGARRHIKDAGDFVTDEEWRQRAQFADEAIEAWEWWNGADGAPPEPPP